MKIAIVGTGYVGLVTGTCFAEIGVNVICVDTNSEKIESLKKGVIPIYENGLEEMVSRNVKAGRLQFTTSLESCLNEVEVVFSAVGTPPDEDGSADLSYVLGSCPHHWTQYAEICVGGNQKYRSRRYCQKSAGYHSRRT